MIPTALYNSYSAALTENDRQCRAALAAVISRLDPDDIDGIRDVLMEAYPALVRLYGRRAAQVAVEFYSSVRDAAEVNRPFAPTLPTAVITAGVADALRDVGRIVGGLYSGKSTIESFSSSMQQMASTRAMRMADSTLHALANADPAHPKVALVPHAGACAWCVLIGSRGFTNSENAMDHMRHDGCKCVTVVDFDRDNPALEGYDPFDYMDEYAALRDDVDFEKQLIEEWNSMSEAEKARYVRRTKTSKGEPKTVPGDWSTYRRNRTLQEMNVLLGRTKSSRIGARGR